jgi:small ligand-binding sensory domain FIST
MRFASSLSVHPVTAHATGEVIGQVIEQVGRHPDLAVLFVTRPHGGELEAAVETVSCLLGPTLLFGCAAESVVGNQREIEQTPAVSLWAGMTGPIVPVRLWAEFDDGERGRRNGEPGRRNSELGRRNGEGERGASERGRHPSAGRAGDRDPDEGPTRAIAGWPEKLAFEPQALLLLADPFSFPVDLLLRDLAVDHPGLPVLGGMASAARSRNGNRLVLNEDVFTDGAVGALIGPGVSVTCVVSQGCRPVGRPLAVTRAEGNIIYELAGQPALHRLLQMAKDNMSQRDVELINQGLHMGLVIDEHKIEFGRGDFLIRNVIGADRSNGAIAIADEVEVGATVQFHVRDADAADEDLRELLADRRAEGVLLFTCNGRGSRLFDKPDHDAGVIGDLLGEPAVSGFFAAGELGPVGGHNFVHGFTASMALFADTPTPHEPSHEPSHEPPAEPPAYEAYEAHEAHEALEAPPHEDPRDPPEGGVVPDSTI